MVRTSLFRATGRSGPAVSRAERAKKNFAILYRFRGNLARIFLAVRAGLPAPVARQKAAPIHAGAPFARIIIKERDPRPTQFRESNGRWHVSAERASEAAPATAIACVGKASQQHKPDLPRRKIMPGIDWDGLEELKVKS